MHSLNVLQMQINAGEENEGGVWKVGKGGDEYMGML